MDSASAIPERLGPTPHSKASLRLWLRLLSCTMDIEKTLQSRLANQFETTLPRFDVLSALDRNPKGLTMGGLAALLKVSNGNTTGIVKRLEDDGLVSRTASKQDRRSAHVRLTARGKSSFSAMAHAHEAWLDELFAGLDSDDIAMVMEAIGRMRTSVGKALSGRAAAE